MTDEYISLRRSHGRLVIESKIAGTEHQIALKHVHIITS